MVSVVVISRNEPYLWQSIESLLKGTDHSLFEVIISDDESDPKVEVDPTRFPNVRVVRSNANRGAGYAFDRGIEEAKYDTLVLMAGDVIVKDPSWLTMVSEYVSKYPNQIGCSCCISGDPEHLDPLFPADNIKRYGAGVKVLATTEDLPSDSPLLGNDYRIELFEAKWFKKKGTDEYNTDGYKEVPVVYGAFYFASKMWMDTIHGWDTVRRAKLSGLSIWGCVDVFPSIKSWLWGGGCYVATDIETLHIFHKYEFKPNGRGDHYWWSKFFTAYTLMDTEEATRLVKKIYSLRLEYGLHTYPFNLGKKLLKDNFAYVMAVRERNKREMVHDFDWFLDKFGIEKIW